MSGTYYVPGKILGAGHNNKPNRQKSLLELTIQWKKKTIKISTKWTYKNNLY